MSFSSNPARRSKMLEWTARVQCEEHEIGGSFSIYIFLSNEVPPKPDQWLFHPTYVGTVDIFTDEYSGQNASYGAHANDIVKGFVHLNHKFLERSQQTSLEPDVVVPYLKQHISWGVTKVNGKAVDLERFTSLEVTVLCTPLELPVGSDYPIEGEPKIYPEITRGRVGGDRSTTG